MAIFVQSRDKLKVKGKKGIKDLARNARFQFCQNHGCMYFNSFTVFMARTAAQVTFIHPQWTGTNVHAKNEEGITLLDCIYGQLIMHINAVQT